MSSRRTPYEHQRATDGLSLLLTGGETDLGRMIFTLLVADAWPVAHIHVLYERRSDGPPAAERFARFCRQSPLTAVLREQLGVTPDLALAERVTLHEAAPAREDLGLGKEGIEALKGSVGAVIIAARSKRPDSDPCIALDRDLRHPLIVQKLFPSAALVLVTDVDAVSDAGIEPGVVVAEKETPRNFDPLVEVARLAQLACHGPRRGDLDAIKDRRAAAFGRARLLGFPTTGGYARALAEALWLRATRDSTDGARHTIVRIGRLAPAEAAPYAGWARDPGVLDALASLVALPVKHLPIAPDALLSLVPVDRAAHDVLFALTAALTNQAPRVMQAVPSDAHELRVDRALSLFQLALRAQPASSSPRGLFRRWVVATADPALAAADIDRARGVMNRVKAALDVVPEPALGAPAGVAALVQAGSAWLQARSGSIDADLRASFAAAACWLPERRLRFSNERYRALAGAAGLTHGVLRDGRQPDAVWRDYFQHTLSGRLARRAVGRAPGASEAPAGPTAAETLAIARNIGAQLLARFRQG